MDPWDASMRRDSQKRSRTESPPFAPSLSPLKLRGPVGTLHATQPMETDGSGPAEVPPPDVPMPSLTGLDPLTMHHFDLPDISDSRTTLALSDLGPPPRGLMPAWPPPTSTPSAHAGQTDHPAAAAGSVRPRRRSKARQSRDAGSADAASGGARPPTSTTSYATAAPIFASAQAPTPTSITTAKGYPVVAGVLKIEQQPASHGRFRYSKEGRKTPLHGRVDGSFPSVSVTPEYRSLIEDGTHVNVSLVTKNMDEQGGPVPHWHVLEGKEGGPVSRPLTNGKATFPNLVVTRTTGEEGGGVRNAEDQHVIRLMYTMMFRDERGRLVQACAISAPIYGLEVKIHHLSHTKVPATGDVDIIVLTSKIKKKNTILRFTELTPSAFDPGPRSAWRLDEDNCLYFDMTDLIVHYQYAVVARVPPFWDPTIIAPRKVSVCLVDTLQKLKSNSKIIEYVPNPFRPHSSTFFNPGHTPSMMGMPSQLAHAWSTPQLDYFSTDAPAGAAAAPAARTSVSRESRSSIDTSSAESSNTSPLRARVYGSFETSV